MAYFLGLDVGTSGLKALLMREDGTVCAADTQEYPLHSSHPGWTEQDPQDWWRALCTACKSLLDKAAIDPKEIRAVGFSGQMHGMVALDEKNEVVRPAPLWNDQRNEKQARELTQTAGGLQGLLAHTNNRMLTGYTGGKLLWLRENEPDNYARTHKVICPKDYIRFRLGAPVGTDVSDASGTGFFDVKKRDWAYDLLRKAGLREDIFAPCTESDAVVGSVSRQASEATGLPEGLELTAGGGDAVIQTTGTGLIRPGVLGMVLGTSGVVAMGQYDCQPNAGGELQYFCGNAANLWAAFGVTMAAGGSYRWYRDVFCASEKEKAAQSGMNIYDYLGQEAATVKPGADGVLFLPWLTGERSPYYDASARSAFLGMGLRHGHAQMTRAVLEGVSFSLKTVADVIVKTGAIRPEKIIVSGGGALSPLWRQIIADVCALPVVTVSGSGEGGAYGAALVAGVAVGAYKDIDQAMDVLREETHTLPNPANEALYSELFSIYSETYAALKRTNERLVALQ